MRFRKRECCQLLLCGIIGFTIFVILQDNSQDRKEVAVRRKVPLNFDTGRKEHDDSAGQNKAKEVHRQVAEPAAGHGLDNWNEQFEKAKVEAKRRLDGDGDDEANQPSEKVTQNFKPGEIGNYELHETITNGPGEAGRPVHTSLADRTKADNTINEYGFNMLVSDQISLNRTLPDTRPAECQYWHYERHSLRASVVIVFINEGWSTLMRTVHSVFIRSPPEMLQEIVMIDDTSSKAHLASQLEEYIKKFGGVVKLYRNKERLGLIQSRAEGARRSVGDVVVFLDAHCEVNVNWLPPLMARIAANRRIVAVPIVDAIDADTFVYRSQYTDGHYKGTWDWGLLYKEQRVSDLELRALPPAFPYKSPTHAGGLLAIDRRYFIEELGMYDAGLRIWGGEQFELSFKVWQCGGAVEWVPCSRVGHLYRSHVPYDYGRLQPGEPLVLINLMRVVEVWWDPAYKEYFYTREPQMRGYPIGDISAQLRFKEELKCKPFKWFMDNVASDVLTRFPPLPPNRYWGELRNAATDLCLDTMGNSVGGRPFGTSGCHHLGGNQLFRLNEKGQFGLGERCIDKTDRGIGLHLCDVMPNGPWRYVEDTQQVKHETTDACLETNAENQVLLNPCVGKPSQKWVWKEVHVPHPQHT